jgi:hypothetical protein
VREPDNAVDPCAILVSLQDSRPFPVCCMYNPLLLWRTCIFALL